MTTVPVTSALRRRGGLRMTPGRWVALVLGVPVALAVIGGTGFSLVSNLGEASFPVSTTFGVQNGHLAASLGGGDVTVRPDPGITGRARLTGTVQYSLLRPRLVVTGTGVSLHCRILTGNCELNATLDVPAGTAVDLASSGGNLRISGIASDVTLDSGGGDVSIAGDGATADVTTGGGNLTASDLGGIVRFSTGGGDVDATGLFAPQVTLESGGGNVTLVFTSVPASLDITSGGGDISVVLPRGARYAITSDPGGGTYSAPVPTDPSSSHKISVTSGGGNISITEST